MEYVRVKYQKPGNVFLHSCHRLDRPVSGVLIMAKTSKGRERMRQVFTDQKAKKTYLALVSKCPDPYEGDLSSWLLKNKAKNVVEVVHGPKPGAVKARTKYRTLGQVGPYFLVELNPVTGKSHQLRAHMRWIGCPIVGDVKYKGVNIQDPSSIMLHCRKMEFVHPIKSVDLVLTADLPKNTLWSRYQKEIFGILMAQS
jgi:23S rRNA pseudouridine1911/1915/1917 synthase